MKNLYLGIQRFVNDEDGVTAIEYGLIASLIAIVIIAAVGSVGDNLNTVFNRVADCLVNGTGGTICNPPAPDPGT